jgi:glutamine synthetase
MATGADILKMIKDKESSTWTFASPTPAARNSMSPFRKHSLARTSSSLGHAFDGSSIAGWKGIEASDMLLMPEPSTARLDPFMDHTTLNITCDVLEPSTGNGYERDPRSLAKRAEAYLKASGLGEIAYFGPEPNSSSSTR